MDIIELIGRKRELEREIVTLVNETLDNFKDKTGVSPSSISIRMDYVHAFGKDSGEYIATDCSVDLDLS